MDEREVPSLHCPAKSHLLAEKTNTHYSIITTPEVKSVKFEGQTFYGGCGSPVCYGVFKINFLKQKSHPGI